MDNEIAIPGGIPPVEELLESAVVVRLPMRTRFRGLLAREVMIFAGPAGWGEFGAFVEYDDAEAANWLRAGIEAAYLGPPPAVRSTVTVNATVPAVPADQVAEVLSRYPGARTAKVKVAEPGQHLDDDVERVAAARAVVDRVRVDANGKWSVAQAITALRAIGPVEYAEQPCATVEELAQVRRAVDVPIAADESIRKAHDPLRVVAADAADVAIVRWPRSVVCVRRWRWQRPSACPWWSRVRSTVPSGWLPASRPPRRCHVSISRADWGRDHCSPPTSDRRSCPTTVACTRGGSTPDRR